MAKVADTYVRQAAVATLRAAVDAGEPLPAASIHGEEAPPSAARPFMMCTLPAVAPFKAVGMDGTTTTLRVHALAEATDDVSAARAARALAGWAADVLDGLALDLVAGDLTDCPFPATAFFEWQGVEAFRDSSASVAGFQAVATFSVSVAS